MVKAKHEFIDDNPYLVYSPDAETTASDSGGDSGGFNIIEAAADTDVLSVKAGELVEMVKNGLVLIKPMSDSITHPWLIVMSYSIGIETGYKFGVLTADGESVETFKFAASTADDYPTPFEGDGEEG